MLCMGVIAVSASTYCIICHTMCVVTFRLLPYMQWYDVHSTYSSYRSQLSLSLSRLLASKNLPAAIEDTSGNEVPESIREKADELQGQGGAAGLEQKIYGLPELLQRNKEIIDEVGVA